MFQFALPHGERRQLIKTKKVEKGFNSRSRMGSDFFCFSLFVAVIAVSIRAPAWGATGQASAIRIVVDSFNSRSRMGSDV